MWIWYVTITRLIIWFVMFPFMRNKKKWKCKKKKCSAWKAGKCVCHNWTGWELILFRWIRSSSSGSTRPQIRILSSRPMKTNSESEFTRLFLYCKGVGIIRLSEIWARLYNTLNNFADQCQSRHQVSSQIGQFFANLEILIFPNFSSFF